MSLIKIGGDTYIIDLIAMTKVIGEFNEDNQPSTGEETETKYTYNQTGELIAKEVTERKFDKGKEIDISKYDTLRMLLDIVMSHNDEIDDTLGIERELKKSPIPFKLAFNTLKYYKVLRNIDI